MANIIRSVISAVTVFNLAGCYEDSKVVIHEPHVYKGKRDHHDSETVANLKHLRQRFEQVQLDR